MSKSLRIAFIMISLALGGTVVFMVLVARMAIMQHEPVMDSSYYEKGLDYEARLRYLRKGEEQGWKLEFPFAEFAELPRGSNIIAVRLTGPSAPGAASLRVMVERPASAKERLTREVGLESAKRTTGGWEFPVEINLSGTGTFEISAEIRVNNEADVYIRRKVVVK